MGRSQAYAHCATVGNRSRGSFMAWHLASPLPFPGI